MATVSAKAKKFEEELKDLEEIVGKIDSGELTLEDSIGAFERGVALVRSLNQKLDEIEKQGRSPEPQLPGRSRDRAV